VLPAHSLFPASDRQDVRLDNAAIRAGDLSRSCRCRSRCTVIPAGSTNRIASWWCEPAVPVARDRVAGGVADRPRHDAQEYQPAPWRLEMRQQGQAGARTSQADRPERRDMSVADPARSARDAPPSRDRSVTKHRQSASRRLSPPQQELHPPATQDAAGVENDLNGRGSVKRHSSFQLVVRREPRAITVPSDRRRPSLQRLTITRGRLRALLRFPRLGHRQLDGRGAQQLTQPLGVVPAIGLDQ
jgi:hypothetical protein